MPRGRIRHPRSKPGPPPISVEDAQRVAKRFILREYPDAKMTFEKIALRHVGRSRILVYEVEGKFTEGIKWLPTKKTRLFKIRLHAYASTVVGFEM